jgi:hypothetical protein
VFGTVPKPKKDPIVLTCECRRPLLRLDGLGCVSMFCFVLRCYHRISGTILSLLEIRALPVNSSNVTEIQILYVYMFQSSREKRFIKFGDI